MGKVLIFPLYWLSDFRGFFLIHIYIHTFIGLTSARSVVALALQLYMYMYLLRAQMEPGAACAYNAFANIGKLC